VEANGKDWGLQGLALPTFCLGEKIARQRSWLGTIAATVNGDLPLSADVDWQTQPAYRLFHYNRDALLPYLKENLQVLSPTAEIAYLGCSPPTLEAVALLWKEVSPAGKRIIDLSALPHSGEPVAADILLVDFYYQRPEYWQRRIEILQRQAERRLSKNAITEQEAAEEVSKFADSVDIEELERQLAPLWEKLLPTIRLQTGNYVILVGCNLYVRPYSVFQEVYAKSKGLYGGRTYFQQLRGAYQKVEVKINQGPEHGVLMEACLGMRRVKRRLFRDVIGHNSLMGLIHLRHDIHRRKQLLERLDLEPQYVHHRLVVLRVI
jgi:hypothetical protein